MERSGRGARNWVSSGVGLTGGLAAIGFTAAYFASMVLTNVPDQGDSEATTRAFYAVASHRVQAVVALYVLGAAMACFLVLLGELVRPLRATAAPGIAADLASNAGAIFAGLSIAAGVAFAAPAASVTLNVGGGVNVDPGFARSASALGDALLLLAAPLACSLFLAAVCIGSRRAGLLPRWLTHSGLVVAAALLAGFTWFPLLLLLAWTLSFGVAALLPVRTARTVLPPLGA